MFSNDYIVSLRIFKLSEVICLFYKFFVVCSVFVEGQAETSTSAFKLVLALQFCFN